IAGATVVFYPGETAGGLHEVVERDRLSVVLLPERHRRGLVDVQFSLPDQNTHQGIHHTFGHRPSQVSRLAIETVSIPFGNEHSAEHDENRPRIAKVFGSGRGKSSAHRLI